MIQKPMSSNVQMAEPSLLDDRHAFKLYATAAVPALPLLGLPFPPALSEELAIPH
jgi:hypothetical protein